MPRRAITKLAIGGLGTVLASGFVGLFSPAWASTRTNVATISVADVSIAVGTLTVPLTATVMVNGTPLSQGFVLFSVTAVGPGGTSHLGSDLLQPITQGCAVATLNVPADQTIGSYTITATLNAAPSMTSTPATGILLLTPDDVTVDVRNVSVPFGIPTVALQATVSTTSGALISDGQVAFKVTDPTAAALHQQVGAIVTAAVADSIATATFTVPSSISSSTAVGTYTLTANFLADGTIYNRGSASATFTITAV